MAQKQSVLLGLREKLEKSFQSMLDDMVQKFKNKQGMFMGERKTYTPIEGFADDPTKRSFKNVESTVGEQVNWFIQHVQDYMQTVFAIEATNATGIKAPLVVDGVTWGEYTTLELLRLKSILDGKLRAMIGSMPIRQESQLWVKSGDPVFAGREVFETPLDRGFSKTTLKETIIVSDPHIKDTPNRQPVVAQIDRSTNVGEYTVQSFSGAVTNMQRATIEVKFNKLYTAVIEALEKANDAPVVSSELGVRAIEYLF